MCLLLRVEKCEAFHKRGRKNVGDKTQKRECLFLILGILPSVASLLMLAALIFLVIRLQSYLSRQVISRQRMWKKGNLTLLGKDQILLSESKLNCEQLCYKNV